MPPRKPSHVNSREMDDMQLQAFQNIFSLLRFFVVHCLFAAVSDKKATTWKELRAHQLRNRPTLAERRMTKPLKDLGFRRSVALFGYIADFYNPFVKLVVEIDGESHADRADYDRDRDAHLMARGIRTLRFTNNQAFENISYALNSIRAAIRDSISGQRNAAESEACGRRAVTREGKAATVTTKPRAT